MVVLSVSRTDRATYGYMFGRSWHLMRCTQHNTTVHVMGTENPHVPRVGFDPKPAGVVRVTKNEVHMIISSPMLEAAFVGAP